VTKDQEKYLFKMFQEKYKDIPTGKVDFFDKPDVILTTPNGETIGIELTECIYDQTLMKESEYQIKFNNKVLDQLEGLMPFKFHLDIELDKTEPLKQNQIESTIKEVVEFCTKEFGNLQSYESKSVEQLDVDWNKAPINIQQHFLDQGYRKLPKGILRIHMSRFDILKKSMHPESKGGVVPDFTQENLNAILIKKEKALDNYKPCNQQWLVIGEGGDFYSYMDNIKIEKRIKTKFDKVFICRRWNLEVVVIK
jgi:hypothetical protein